MQTTILELAAQILTSRQVSRSEHQLIATALAQNEVDEQERTLIERVLYGVRHGLLKVTDG
ncbi:MAG: hypothetical protein HC910_05715 [Spirulinaceae cyanobacterium SM2_1_0]|nr:hypothetical protein [Spirulinaceae cyanobacterium SM2_1_0]